MSCGAKNCHITWRIAIYILEIKKLMDKWRCRAIGGSFLRLAYGTVQVAGAMIEARGGMLLSLQRHLSATHRF